MPVANSVLDRRSLMKLCRSEKIPILHSGLSHFRKSVKKDYFLIIGAVYSSFTFESRRDCANSFLILISIIIQQYRLPISSLRFSINTTFYLSLGICLITWELILLFFHLIVKSEQYKSRDC